MTATPRSRTPRRGARAALLLVPLVGLPAAAAIPVHGQAADTPGPPAERSRPAAEAAADSLAGTVDRLFAEWDRPGSPGAAVVVVRDGRVLHAAGYGEAQIEYGIPIEPATVFHVASVSKQFTAFAIHLLAERGELSLDDDVRRWVPEVPDFGRAITLRHLVHHTSGLRDQWALLQMAGWRLDDVITEEDVFGLLARQRDLNFDPGTEYTYSNTGYTLLAEVVERVTGEPFPAWMEANVFGPLGMERTHFHDDHRMVVPGRAYSYDRAAEGEAAGFRNAVLSYANVGATSLFTTVEDLARWIRNFEEPRVGAPETLARMAERGVLAGGDTLSYAAGLIVGEHRGLRTVGHSGGDAGFRSHLIHFPEQRLGVVVLANLGPIDTGGLARRVAEVYLGDVMAPAESPRTPPIAGGGTAGDAPRADSAALGRVAGHYWEDDGALLRRLVVRDGRLVYGRPGAADSELLPLGDGTFAMAGVPVRVEVRFEPAEGRPERMTVSVEGEAPAVFEAVEAWAPGADELRAYAGAYRSAELARTWRVEVAEGALRVVHPRHGVVRLEPAVRDAFSGEVWWLQTVRFTRGTDGTVDGMEASNGRVRDLRFDRLPARRAGAAGSP